MEIQTQTSQNMKVITKKKFTVTTFLIIYGALSALSLVLSIFTVPISIDENLKFIYDEKLMLKPNEIKEYLLFIFGSTFVYFFILYLRRKDLQR